MADAGEIKAKVSIEYDGSGIEQAKKDLASLGEVGGNLEETLSGAGDQLAEFGNKAEKGASGTKTFNETLAELPKIVEGGGSAVAEMSGVLDEHRAAIEETGSAYEDLQRPVEAVSSSLEKAAPAMQTVSEHTRGLNENLSQAHQSFSDLSTAIAEPGATQSYTNLWKSMSGESLGASPLGNFEVFQRAYNAIDSSGMYDAAGGMQMIDEHLDRTGQSYEQFAGTLSGKNQQLLHEMSMDWSQMGVTMDGAGQSFQKTGEKAQAGFSTIASSSGDADQAVAEFLGKTSKAMDSAGASTGQWVETSNGFMAKLGNVMEGPAYSKPVSLGGAFGEVMGGITGALNDIAMPLMAVQMIGMAVGQVGQAMYDSAAIAEGPAAHSFGTFTGTVDALGQSLQHAAGQFSEGFGQGLMPMLNALNGQAGGLDLGGLGQFLGGVGATVANLTMIATGINPLGGMEGLINQGASMLGLQQPFQGPPPISQYQRQMAAIPQTIRQNTEQTQYQANLTMEEATDPGFLASQQQAQAAQTIYQRAQQRYDTMHPVNLQKMASDAQYNLYAQQQGENYQYQMNNQPSWAQDIGDYWGGFFSSIGRTPPPLSNPNARSTAQGYGSDYYGQTGYGGGAGGGGSISDFFGGIGKSISDFWNQPNGGADTLGMLFSPQAWGFGQSPQTFSGGCFVAGTLVLLADGTEKPIEALRVDEQVLAYDGKQQVPATIIGCISFPAKQTYALTFDDGNTLITTDSHPLAGENGWKSISPGSTAQENPDLPVTALQVGDTIYTAGGTLCRLVSIQKRNIEQVYNITVDTVHTYYASNILVHNAKASSVGSMTNGGVGSEQVQLSHTFTANIQWEANNLQKQFTGAASWVGQNLANTFQGAASWVAQGLSNTFQAATTWVAQGLSNTFNGIANWVGQNLANTFNGVANWVGENLANTFNGVASWVGQGLQNTFKGVASWVGQGLEHTFNAVANWTAQNLTPNFTVNPSFTMLAEGTSNWPGGPAMVGEGGAPEVVEHNGQYSLIDHATLLDLPQGANVYPMKNLQSSGVAQFADGTGNYMLPLTIGIPGGGMPQSFNLTVQIGENAILSSMGIPLAQDIRVATGNRSY